ncbi:MAG: NAD(P)H-dependent oxidoreductase [Lachnospiraceae bacterium]|nr:NAD(P)H-dependent oxidoreductase [Lachnospiraceae bacterium]
MKSLVVYFSAESGTTAKVAEKFAQMAGADLFQITPQKVYTRADLNWTNPLARCNREHFAKKDVPVAGTVKEFAAYDMVYIGFPIWYGCAPNVVNTFCKDYDWSGKKVYVFATSGGSGIGKTAEKLQPYVGGAEIVSARLVSDASQMKDWIPAMPTMDRKEELLYSDPSNPYESIYIHAKIEDDCLTVVDSECEHGPDGGWSYRIITFDRENTVKAIDFLSQGGRDPFATLQRMLGYEQRTRKFREACDERGIQYQDRLAF